MVAGARIVVLLLATWNLPDESVACEMPGCVPVRLSMLIWTQSPSPRVLAVTGSSDCCGGRCGGIAWESRALGEEC